MRSDSLWANPRCKSPISFFNTSRKRDTGDSSQDVAFTDDRGVYMIFPVRGGSYNSANRKLKQHERTPSASSQRVFIRPCRNREWRSTLLRNLVPVRR